MEISEQVFYKEGYKFQLTRPLVAYTGIYLGEEVKTDYFTMTADGYVILVKGYAWNGASCFPDFDWIIRGSAIHDAGYQALRLGLIPRRYKVVFDSILGINCIEDRAIKIVAKAVHSAVVIFGVNALRASSEPLELAAPAH